MTRYTVRYYNEAAKAWGVWHTTFDMSDAYTTHTGLVNRGYKASIQTSYVADNG